MVKSQTHMDLAAQQAHEAIDRMVSDGVVPTPSHFMLWFEATRLPDSPIGKAINGLQREKSGVNDAMLARLLADFLPVEMGDQAVMQASNRLSNVLSTVKSDIDELGNCQNTFSSSLEDLSGALQVDEEAGDASSLRHLVMNILEETRVVIVQNRALEDRLNESAQQVDDLRVDLEKVRVEARTDGLTRLCNRKAFDVALEAAAIEADESEGAAALVLADIDHFKRFNDTHGHRVGDEVLRLRCPCHRNCTGDADTPARFGGEEFAVVLPSSDAIRAMSLAEQIRETWRRRSWSTARPARTSAP